MNVFQMDFTSRTTSMREFGRQANHSRRMLVKQMMKSSPILSPSFGLFEVLGGSIENEFSVKSGRGSHWVLFMGGTIVLILILSNSLSLSFSSLSLSLNESCWESG